LASGGETAAFSSFTMTQETTVPPCHQTRENSDMEMSSDEEEDDEIKTIIARARPVAETSGFIK
jgi:phosphoribosylcarboxyaminoimidazole (NCAIR) mutase